MATKYKPMKVPELIKLTKSRGLIIAGLSRKRKAELIEELVEDDESRSQPTRKEAERKKQRTAKPQAKEPVYTLELVQDFGTSKWCMSYVILCDGQRIENFATSLYIHAQGSIEVPMVAAWIDGELVQGHTLLKLAKNDRNISNKMMHFFKLLLYCDPETADVTETVEGVLREEGKEYVDLLAEHMKATLKDARPSFIRQERSDKFSESMLGAMFDRATVRFTVPQMWEPGARRTMQTAAKMAGIATVVLASEAWCAIPWWVDKAAQKKHAADKQWGAGDSLLLADLGAGTADIGMVEFEERLTVKSKMKAVRHASGALAGSARVDKLLLEMFLSRKGKEWQEKARKDLKVTPRGFKRRLLIKIEDIRIKFDPKEDEDEFDHIRVKGGKEVKVDINKAEYESAMKEVLKAIKDHLREFVQHKKPSVIVVVGGFSKSLYVMDDLIACFKSEGIDVVCPNEGLFGMNSPVALGAPLRYSFIAKQHLPSQFAYAVLVTMPYHPEDHPDEDPEEFPSFYKPEITVLHDRMRIIIQIGDQLEEGKEQELKLPFTHYVPQDKPFISVDCVYMTEIFEDHAAAKLLHETEFRPGVKPWLSAEMPIDRSLLEGKGFPEWTAPNGERFWIVEARAKVVYRNEDMRFAFNVLKPLESIGENDGDVAFCVEEELWDAHHSELLEA